MKVQDFGLLRSSVAMSLILLLLAPVTQAAPRQAVPNQQLQTQTSPATNSNLPQAPTAQNRQTSPEPQPGNPSEPVGTAVAPLESPVGAAVSRPTGAAIAPAKQKRRHTLIIRLGLVVGAAVAIGTVVALSKASPNRPNQ